MSQSNCVGWEGHDECSSVAVLDREGVMGVLMCLGAPVPVSVVYAEAML